MAATASLRALATAAAFVAGSAALAMPVLGEPTTAGALRVYPDDRDPRTYYYAPGPLAVGEAPQGGPELRFLQMVYVGTAVTGDVERSVARSVLAFQVAQQPVPADTLAAARAELPAGSMLRALPVSRVESRVVWTPVEGGGDAPREVGPARFEEKAGAPAAEDGTWTERQVVVTPGPYDSQLLWDALHRGRVVLSFGWAHHAVGLPQRPAPVAATPALALGEAASSPPPPAPEERVVSAGAVEIEADATRWPDRYRRVDLNQTVPPAFAALEARCYDFADALRPDLDRKIVEVRATTAGGRKALQAVTFHSASAVPVATIRFAQAVRLDRPYRWRTLEVGKDGRVATSEWTERADWIPVLDVTSPPEARPVPAPSPKEDP